MGKVRKAIIPVAGMGTRFLPATKAIPKEMIPIVDIPMVQLIVEEAVASGIEDIIFVTARHKEALENHFDFNYELDDRLSKAGKEELFERSQRVSKMANIISIRQKNPMGLGHAVYTAAPIIGDEPFAVILGDDLIDAEPACTKQLIDVFENKNQSVVGVMKVEASEVSKYGIVGGDHLESGLTQVKEVVEKPQPKDAPSQLAMPGRYVLQPSVMKHLKEVKPGRGGEIQLTDGLLAEAKANGLLAFEYDGVRYDAGDRLGYIDATLAYALKRPDLAPGVKALMKKHLGGQ